MSKLVLNIYYDFFSSPKDSFEQLKENITKIITNVMHCIFDNMSK